MIKYKNNIKLIVTILLLLFTLTLVITKVSNNTTTSKNLTIIATIIIAVVTSLFKFKGKVINEILEWIYFLSISLSVVLIITTFFIFTSIVKGNSMIPTLNDKQRVFVSVFNYKPKHEDLLIYQMDESSTEDSNTLIVKRVVALEGDIVSFKKNDLISKDYIILINGEEYSNVINSEYHILDYQKLYTDIVTNGNKEYKLKKNEVLILGDNENKSYDSRSIGVVNYDRVIGKVLGH